MSRPKSAQSRNESDLCQKSLRMLQTTKDPIERIRLACLARGSAGILGLGRVFKRMDDDGSKRLHFDEFRKGIDETLTELTDLTADDEKQLFDSFDKDNNGSVGYEEFLRAIRPPMTAARVKQVEEAYKKLDKSGDGTVTLSDLASLYSVKHHPQYISGELDEKQVMQKFMSNFEGEEGNADDTITMEEFLNYYSGVSASIDSDAYFDLMMRNCWKL